MAKIREGMTLRRASQLVVDQVGISVCICGRVDGIGWGLYVLMGVGV